jgi:hypothetical protein
MDKKLKKITNQKKKEQLTLQKHISMDLISLDVFSLKKKNVPQSFGIFFYNTIIDINI